MKIAFAGKGGSGKTTLAAWVGDYLARQGWNVWMVDADTALSLGQASGLSRDELPVPLVQREDLIQQYIGEGIIQLTPDVGGLPSELAVSLPVSSNGRQAGDKRLLVMGSVAGAGGGCACSANSLLKSVLGHLVMKDKDIVLVDLEAGVEHLGRGTVEHVDGLVVVSEPSRRSLQVAEDVSRLAGELHLDRQCLVLNRTADGTELKGFETLPEFRLTMPVVAGLQERQLESSSVLGLPEQKRIDALCAGLLEKLGLSV